MLPNQMEYLFYLFLFCAFIPSWPLASPATSKLALFSFSPAPASYLPTLRAASKVPQTKSGKSGKLVYEFYQS
jgi:hypothetical protein